MEDDSWYSEEEFAEWSRIVLEDESKKEWERIENESWEEGNVPDQEDRRDVLCEHDVERDDWEVWDEEGSGEGSKYSEEDGL